MSGKSPPRRLARPLAATKKKKLAKKYILKIEENNDKYSPLKKLRINNLELKCAIWKHRK